MSHLGEDRCRGQVAVCAGPLGVHAVPKLLTVATVNCFTWEGLKIPEGSYTDKGRPLGALGTLTTCLRNKGLPGGVESRGRGT